MKVDIETGLLTDAIFLPSSHCDERPQNMPIDMVVVHGISLPPGQFGTGAVEKLFCGQLDFSEHPYYADLVNLKVAAHLLISRKGLITQFVPFAKRGWHAGVSYFEGRMNCNDFSIGIELEGTDEIPYEKIQYQQLALVIKALMAAYPDIRRQHIVGHSDIAPGRKTDPGPHFDWGCLNNLLDKSK